MKTKQVLLTVLSCSILLLSACQPRKTDKKKSMSSIKKESLTEAKDSLTKMYGDADSMRIRKGVEQAAEFWIKTDGPDTSFVAFCKANFIPSGPELDTLFDKYNYYFEQIFGHYNMLTIELMRNIHEPRGTVKPVDESFGAYDVTAHFNEDMFHNKTAFVILLNFPNYSLAEKNAMAEKWSPRQWGMARLGDMFVSRAPADLILKASETMVAGDNYISNYNIFMGNLLNDKGEKLFPEDKILITHWGLRDELKSNYSDSSRGIEKQEMIFQVMQRIIDQSIPEVVINNPNAQWNPFSNVVTVNGKTTEAKPEPDSRYEVLLSNFKAQKELDDYYPFYENTISRKFDGEMEMAQADVEKLFVDYVSSPVMKDIARLIEKRLHRKLRPFDIWYNGFTSRAGMNEADLDGKTTSLYPDNVAFKNALPQMLEKLGFEKDKAAYIASFIAVDPATGSGHAWGAAMKSDVSHLRTRIVEGGMNYKGYNIAVHEFGHNVEQTISLHFVDNYMLHGVPNTAFTEALAFMFQSRDLQLLGLKNEAPDSKDFENLEIAWSLYEIMGVALVDMKVWKWMYEHPKCKASELKIAVNDIAKDVWNQYYAPVFGVKDQTILAIYSHMIDNPLYLSAYPLGHLIQFQLEQHVKDKDFAGEVLRIFAQGRLTPDAWMLKATGSKLSAKPLLDAAASSVKAVN